MEDFGYLLIFLFFVYLYFLPTFKAIKKRRKDKFWVFLINLIIGWTILGWLGCLVWVAQNDE